MKLTKRIIIGALLLGFCWFAFEKIETRQTVKLSQQIEDLNARLLVEAAEAREWKLKYKSVQENNPPVAEIDSNGK